MLIPSKICDYSLHLQQAWHCVFYLLEEAQYVFLEWASLEIVTSYYHRSRWKFSGLPRTHMTDN